MGKDIMKKLVGLSYLMIIHYYNGICDSSRSNNIQNGIMNISY